MGRAINTRITRRDLINAGRWWHVLRYRLDDTAKQAIRRRHDGSRYWSVMASTWVDAPSPLQEWRHWAETLPRRRQRTWSGDRAYWWRLQRRVGPGAGWLDYPQRLKPRLFKPVRAQVDDGVDAAILHWSPIARALQQ